MNRTNSDSFIIVKGYNNLYIASEWKNKKASVTDKTHKKIERITEKLRLSSWNNFLIFGKIRYPAKMKAAITDPVLWIKT